MNSLQSSLKKLFLILEQFIHVAMSQDLDKYMMKN